MAVLLAGPCRRFADGRGRVGVDRLRTYRLVGLLLHDQLDLKKSIKILEIGKNLNNFRALGFTFLVLKNYFEFCQTSRFPRTGHNRYFHLLSNL